MPAPKPKSGYSFEIRMPSLANLGTAALFTALIARPVGAAPAQSVPSGDLEVVFGPAARRHREVRWDRTPPARARAWRDFTRSAGPGWRTLWDQSTDVPHRIFGRGIAAPGSVQSASSAESHARAFLKRHLALLAPGASPTDFVLTANEVHRGLRTVTFRQTWQGMDVIGGAIAMQFKNDQLFIISSQALPHVSARPRAARPLISDSKARDVSRAWLLQDATLDARPRGAVEGPMVLPIIHGRKIQYRTVMRARVESRRPFGQWNVYIDAHSGLAVARRNTIRAGSGRVLYNTPVRRPDSDRANYPAPHLAINFTAGGSATSDADGIVTWVGDGSIQVTLGADGPLVGITNDVGDPAGTTLNIPSGGDVVWDASGDELVDAQLTAFIHAHVVKEYARTFAGGLDWLNEKLPVVVNIDDQCNAFSDGNQINFFQSSDDCQNTGRLPDVVYHEFGHSLHANSIIQGMGAFDGALSEGVSDYLAATITGDSGMGRGFFYGNAPLREIDPVDFENTWPIDLGGVHFTGLIFAGAMWDLRKLLVEEYGVQDGVALSDRLYYSVLQSASDIPSSYVAVIAEDDDDGNLDNGTPNICLINEAFGRHGLRTLSATVEGLAAEEPTLEGHPMTVSMQGLFEACPGDVIVRSQLSYHPQGEEGLSETIDLTPREERGVFDGVIPSLKDPPGVIQYQIEFEFADGSVRTFPENPAEPTYQFYIGQTVPLYCTDFETDPFSDGWESGLLQGEESEGANDWQWGEPGGFSGSGDPSVAFSGTSVIGNDLGNSARFNGKYQANKENFVRMPAVEIGRYSDVRLQYRRWLTVEDAFFDQARIKVDDFVAWENFDSDNGNQSTVHHRDQEWVFHDVALSPFITNDTFQLSFSIESDAGLEFGGWTIDDLCIVADINSICGDGRLSGAEQCDDGPGNSDTLPNACRDNCRVAGCGDGVRDGYEQCDDGNLESGDGCDSSCKVENSGGCGFSVTGPPSKSGGGLGALIGLGLLGLLWRRRARSQS